MTWDKERPLYVIYNSTDSFATFSYSWCKLANTYQKKLDLILEDLPLFYHFCRNMVIEHNFLISDFY